MAKTPAILRVRMLRPANGPHFFADAGEERVVSNAHGQQLLAAGDAELVKPTKPVPPPAPAARKR